MMLRLAALLQALLDHSRLQTASHKDYDSHS